jgi:type IV secretion system protein VirB6
LAAPASTLSIVLTGFLTILIAVVGYDLLLGRTLSVREGMLAFVKIGAVFALATSWPTYRALVYDLVTDGPSQLVAEVGPQAGLVGSNGTLVQRLDLADQTLTQLAILGPGNPPRDAAGDVPPPPFAGFDAFALGGSKILFELTAVASLGIVRIVTGLMLALGPFFIAFLMFESTRSLFEGWVRVLGGTALAAIGVSVALGLELALIEPWLGNVLARRMAGEALPAVAVELFVIVSLFSMIVVAAFYACTRIARAFRLAAPLHLVPVTAGQPRMAGEKRLFISASPAVVEGERSRAAAVAGILTATTRREQGAIEFTTSGVGMAGSRAPATTNSETARQVTAPVGRSFTRRPHSRATASAARRDTIG